jgi:hypothetical protein
VLFDKKQDHYLVQVGMMGGQATRNLVYKPGWFAQHLPELMFRMGKGEVKCELEPLYQGFNLDYMTRTDEDRVCGVMRGLHTVKKDDDLLILAVVRAMGPHQTLFEAMMNNDPEGSTWEFRLRAQLHDRIPVPSNDPNSKVIFHRRTMIPDVVKAISWDLFLK